MRQSPPEKLSRQPFLERMMSSIRLRIGSVKKRTSSRSRNLREHPSFAAKPEGKLALGGLFPHGPVQEAGMRNHPLWGRQGIGGLVGLLCVWVAVVLLMSECVRAGNPLLSAFFR